MPCTPNACTFSIGIILLFTKTFTFGGEGLLRSRPRLLPKTPGYPNGLVLLVLPYKVGLEETDPPKATVSRSSERS